MVLLPIRFKMANLIFFTVFISLTLFILSSAVTPNKSKECQPNFWAFDNYCFQLVDDGKRWALVSTSPPSVL